MHNKRGACSIALSATTLARCFGKSKKGLSAGRVQSVALRLIIDREKEIQSFQPEEYWTIQGTFVKGNDTFEAQFYRLDNETFDLKTEQDVQHVLSHMQGNEFVVTSVTKKNESAIRLHHSLHRHCNKRRHGS